MAETTGIAWTDSTWNPWIGCTKVSPGCDHCYAEALDARYQWGGGTHWSPGVPRHRTSAAYWKQPHRWNSIAHFRGRPWRVFPSLCDPFDNEVPEAWRQDFWELIAETQHLTWLLLTKRIGNAARMMETNTSEPFPNVWLGASIVNQEEADRDIPKLLAVPAAKRFISYEPALGPVDWTRISLGKAPMRVSWSGPHEEQFRATEFTINALKGAKSLNWPALDQIIVGGESDQGGHKARTFNIEWARSTVRQCKAAGVAVFVKQIGSNPMLHGFTGYPKMKDRAGADPVDWPADIRVQEFPA